MTFQSPLTGLSYVSLVDVFPPFPDEATKFKMIRDAIVEIRESEKESVDSWDAVFIALVNRQITILEKAKSMLMHEKFFVKHHGDPYQARSLNEFEIIPNLSKKDGGS